MPRVKHPESVEYQLARELNRQREIRARQVAAHQGPPPGARRLTEAEETRLWNLRDRRVDLDALKSGAPLDPQLLAEHPSRQRVLELIGAGALPEAATLLAYPYRYRLMVAGRPGIREQTEYAERMAQKSANLRERLAEIDPHAAIAAPAQHAPGTVPETLPKAAPAPQPGPEGQPSTAAPTGPADAHLRMGLSQIANPGRTPGVPGQHDLTRIGDLAKRIASGQEQQP